MENIYYYTKKWRAIDALKGERRKGESASSKYLILFINFISVIKAWDGICKAANPGRQKPIG